MYGSNSPTQIWKYVLDNSLANSDFETFPQAYPVRYGKGSPGSGYYYYTPTPLTSPSTGGNAGAQTPAESTPAEPPAEESSPPAENPLPELPENPLPPAPEAPSIEDLIPQGNLQDLFR